MSITLATKDGQNERLKKLIVDSGLTQAEFIEKFVLTKKECGDDCDNELLNKLKLENQTLIAQNETLQNDVKELKRDLTKAHADGELNVSDLKAENDHLREVNARLNVMKIPENLATICVGLIQLRTPKYEKIVDIQSAVNFLLEPYKRIFKTNEDDVEAMRKYFEVCNL